MGSARSDDVVTVVAHRAFCVSGGDGDIVLNSPHGLFYGNERVLSRWELRLERRGLEPLTMTSRKPSAVRFVARRAPQPGTPDSTLLVVRDRRISRGLRETLTLQNYGPEPSAVIVELRADADFADPLAVKARRAGDRHAEMIVEDNALLLLDPQDPERNVSISASEPPQVRPGSLTWRIVVPGNGGRWRTRIFVRPAKADKQHKPRRAARKPHDSRGFRAIEPSGHHGPTRFHIDDPDLDTVLRRTVGDLRQLRIDDGSGHRFLAAGAPWYMSLFGRDSLLSAWMALPWDGDIALGTLRLLADLQGRRCDPFSDEEPGRIPHEIRRHHTSDTVLGGEPYYGTADATPLFVMLLAEAYRWGADPETVRALLPAADAAVHWLSHYGDRDGDGFVEYERACDRGVANQGWKDSDNSVTDVKGRIAQPPIALCEVQGYTYAALRARAELADGFADRVAAQRLRDRAAALRHEFTARFWLPDKGWYAIALDRDKRPFDALTSNTAQCLWTGIAADDHVARIVERLADPAMNTGFGLRTLASTMPAYNPMSYHNGSVWPHDTAIAVAGLLRYRHIPGAVDLATKLATGLIDAAAAFEGRLPELFCGYPRSRFPEPVPYPPACRPQAWASAAPLLILRSFLGMEPNAPQRTLALQPCLPKRWGTVELTAVRLGRAQLTIKASGHRVRKTKLPPAWKAIPHEPPKS